MHLNGASAYLALLVLVRALGAKEEAEVVSPSHPLDSGLVLDLMEASGSGEGDEPFFNAKSRLAD